MFKALDATQGCRACLPCAPQYKAGGTLLPTGHIASMEDREEGEDASCTGGRFSASAGQSPGELGRGDGTGSVCLCEHAILAKAPPHLQL